MAQQARKEAPRSAPELLSVPTRLEIRPEVFITSQRMARLYLASDESNVLLSVYQRMRRNPFSPFAMGYDLALRGIRQSNVSPQVFGWAREMNDWFGQDVLGPDVAGRFSNYPPFFASPSARYQRLAFSAHGIDIQAEYHPHTNLILLFSHYLPNAAMKGPAYEANARNLLAHEIFHYASFLGGGGTAFRWRERSGRRDGRICSWLHEGLTELHAQQLTRSRGFSPTVVAYPHETSVSFLLQQLVILGVAADPSLMGRQAMRDSGRAALRGDMHEAARITERRGMEVLRQAYLSGDFTSVRNIVNRALGAGAFETLIAQRDGASALAYLEGRLERSGIDYERWYRNDPVMRLIE